jgi:forkhead box protein K
MQDQSDTRHYAQSGPVRSSSKSTTWQPYQAHAYSPSKAADKVRPSIPYAQLIAEAIESSPEGKITLNGIYTHVSEHYPYFQSAGAGWKVNGVINNLGISIP